MVNEDNELLFQDLSARLPYGVKLKIRKWKTPVELTIIKHSVLSGNYIINENYRLDDIKPYLRPLSSMTEEEYREFNDIRTEHALKCLEFSGKESFELGMRFQQEEMSYLYQRHYDICGLIPKGLALEAKEGMYNII